MSTDFGLGGVGDYNIFSTMSPMLEQLMQRTDDEGEPITGLHCLSGLYGWEAVPVIRAFFKKVSHYQLFEHDRSVLDDFPADGVITIMTQLARLMADCHEKPYEKVSVY